MFPLHQYAYEAYKDLEPINSRLFCNQGLIALATFEDIFFKVSFFLKEVSGFF